MKKLILGIALFLAATFSVQAQNGRGNTAVNLTIVGGQAVTDSLNTIRLTQQLDSLYRAGQILTKVSKKDTTTEAGGSYFTATQAKTDSVNRNVLIGKKVAKADTTTEAGGSYVTPTQFKADTAWAKNRDTATRTLAQDTANTKLNRSELAMIFGTATISVTDSTQVTVANLTTATGFVLASYRTPNGGIASADTVAGVRINTAGKVTLTGKNGSTIDYWVIRK